MGAPISLPTGLVVFSALWTLLSVADGGQLCRRYAELYEIILGLFCPAISQREIVFSRTAFIAMAFYHHFGSGKILENVLQRRGILRHGRASIRPQVILVEIEVGVPSLRANQFAQ